MVVAIRAMRGSYALISLPGMSETEVSSETRARGAGTVTWKSPSSISWPSVSVKRNLPSSLWGLACLCEVRMLTFPGGSRKE